MKYNKSKIIIKYMKSELHNEINNDDNKDKKYLTFDIKSKKMIKHVNNI